MGENTTVAISHETKEQLRYLAKVTKIPQKRLLSLIISELYSIGANFSQLSLSFDSVVRESKIYIFCSGKSKLSFVKPEGEKID